MENKNFGIVLTTNDYDKFHFLKGNRDLRESNLRNIEKSIKENGYNHLSFIIVDQNWNIIDGQHRFIVCKKLGLPVIYIQQYVDNPEKDVEIINNNKASWKIGDYVASYAKQGREDYIILNNLMKTNKINVRIALSLLFIEEGKTKQMSPRTEETRICKGYDLNIGKKELDRFYRRIYNLNLLDKFTSKQGAKLIKNVGNYYGKFMKLLDTDYLVAQIIKIREIDKDFYIDMLDKREPLDIVMDYQRTHMAETEEEYEDNPFGDSDEDDDLDDWDFN